jgi:hypothetical protein
MQQIPPGVTSDDGILIPLFSMAEILEGNTNALLSRKPRDSGKTRYNGKVEQSDRYSGRASAYNRGRI